MKYIVREYKEGWYNIQIKVRVPDPKPWDKNRCRYEYQDLPGIYEIYDNLDLANFDCKYKNYMEDSWSENN